jgi:hypothetical protein
MDPGNRLRDRERFECMEQSFDEGTSPDPSRACRAMNAVQQLADGDHADRILLVVGESIEGG